MNQFTARVLSLLIASLFVIAQANANLIVNGGFEQNDIKNNSWAWFYSTDVAGWEGSNIEIWDNFQKFEAYEGRQYAELNAHGKNTGAFSIFQTFNTIAGFSYDLSFAYGARRSLAEQFELSLLAGNNSFYQKLVDDHTIKNWSEFNYQFTAQGSQTTVVFTSLNTGTYGNFIDDVVVTASKIPNAPRLTQVPEPNTIFLLAIALFAIVRFKK